MGQTNSPVYTTRCSGYITSGYETFFLVMQEFAPTPRKERGRASQMRCGEAREGQTRTERETERASRNSDAPILGGDVPLDFSLSQDESS